MEKRCPRCGVQNPPVARFCGRCGLTLTVGIDGTQRAGRVRHARPLPVPEGYLPCQDAADLYYRRESALGGAPLLATEGLKLLVFNAGYPLRDVVLRISGWDKDDAELFALERELAELPAGKPVALEIPSYELPAPQKSLRVELASAEFEVAG